MYRWGYAITCAVLATGCLFDPAAAPSAEPRGSATDQLRRDAAAEVAAALSEPAARDRVLAALRARGVVALDDAELAIAVDAAGMAPELWLREPPGGSDELLVAYAPPGDERHWTAIPAYTVDGDRVDLDPHDAPDATVIVVETHGRLALRESVEAINAGLRRAGLQRTPAPAAAATGRWTIRLDQIRLEDDLEPWISGAAEIYAIASGVIGDNQPELRAIELPYLDSDGTTYAPNQILVDWTHYGYQAVNVQLFEHDENVSYQELVTALVTAVGAVGSLVGYPEVQAITEIANRIIAAMPASWFSNDDDYVDSFYTVEKNRTYSGFVGVSRNATLTLRPYYLAPNVAAQ